MSKNINKKVLIAISGGVDSSVSAALLKKQNFDVVGVFLKMLKKYDKEALRSARAVCDKLNIPFYIFDVSTEFKKQVVDYFIRSYESGQTPNPCVVCNKKIKFGWLINKAKQLGCDYISTGHYAQIKCKVQNAKRKTTIQNLKQYQLYRAKDKTKDQSYFLWQLDQKQLSKIIFPLGDYTKSEVKKLAKRFKLPINTKEESQDICFISRADRTGFMRTHAEKLTKSGNIVDKTGNVLGKHKGLCYYTIGQRKNLGNINHKLFLNKHPTSLKLRGTSRPKKVFVIELDVSKNQLIVGEEKDLYSKQLTADKINWIDSDMARKLLDNRIIRCKAKIRYGHKPSKCKMQNACLVGRQAKCKLSILFNKPQGAISPGQSIVFYQKDKLLGGAIIK